MEKGYAIKIYLDKESFDSMNKAIQHLNEGEFLFVNNLYFIKMAINFYSDMVINSKGVGIVLGPKNKYDTFERNTNGLKKNYSIPVNLSKASINNIHKAIKCLADYGFFKPITITSFTRMAVIYFSKYAVDNKLGLYFRPPKEL